MVKLAKFKTNNLTKKTKNYAKQKHNDCLEQFGKVTDQFLSW
jgi:hypothetical protein